MTLALKIVSGKSEETTLGLSPTQQFRQHTVGNGLDCRIWCRVGLHTPSAQSTRKGICGINTKLPSCYHSLTTQQPIIWNVHNEQLAVAK